MRCPTHALSLTTIVAAVALLAAGAFAQTSTTPFQESLNISAIEVTIEVRDANGNTPKDLQASDFRLLEDGKEKPVIGIEYLSEHLRALEQKAAEPQSAPPGTEKPLEWTTVIYFDHVLSAPGTIRDCANRLAEQAPELTRLGTVEIVSADPTPKIVLPASREAAAVAATLEEIGQRAVGRQQLANLRRDFLIQMDSRADDQAMRLSGNKKGPEALDIERKMLIRMSAMQEYQLISRVQDKLLGWVGRYPESGPRAIFLVSDGFDLDPRDWYLDGFNEDRSLTEARSELQPFVTASQNDSMAKVLAAAGWTAMTIAPGYLSTFAGGASESGHGKAASFLQGTGNTLNDSPVLLLEHPLDPLRTFADATGGSAMTDPAKLGSAVEGLRDRIRLTYQVSRLADTKLHRIEVKTRRAGLTVNAPKYTGATTQEATAAARARDLLDGSVRQGDLAVRCDITMDPKPPKKGIDAGTLEALIDFLPLQNLVDKLRSTTLRMTTAVEPPEGIAFVQSETQEKVDLSAHRGIRYDSALRFTHGSKRVAFVVEELATGAWGGCVAPIGGGAGAGGQ